MIVVIIMIIIQDILWVVTTKRFNWFFFTLLAQDKIMTLREAEREKEREKEECEWVDDDERGTNETCQKVLTTCQDCSSSLIFFGLIWFVSRPQFNLILFQLFSTTTKDKKMIGRLIDCRLLVDELVGWLFVWLSGCNYLFVDWMIIPW